MKETLFWPNSDTFSNLDSFTRYTIPTAFMQTIECWLFEMLTLMASYISIEAFAAQVILYNIDMIFTMVAFGTSQAATVVVGNAIGENDVTHAKKFARLVIIL